MGCWGSKAGADVAVADAYRPPPTSVSLFDISAVEEPWLIAKNKAAGDEEDDDQEEEETDEDDDEEEKKNVVPLRLPLLEKLEGYELAPASWSEVSKALEDMKPEMLLDSNTNKPPDPKKKTAKKKKKKTNKEEEEEPAAAAAQTQEQKLQPPPNEEVGKKSPPPPPELAGRRVVKDNPFLMRDRESSSKAGNAPRWKRRDPFEGCPERRPPGAAGGGVVLYTTTLHGVRRTFEDCERAREVVEACAEAAGVGAVDERDVSLHGEYLRELRELAGDGAAAPPRLFVMGRYVGGAEECVNLAESGRLREMMRWVKARGEAGAAMDGRGCEGCGGARFVPCWDCGGSRRKLVVVEGGGGGGHQDQVERCAKCNENGLMMCPLCH